MRLAESGGRQSKGICAFLLAAGAILILPGSLTAQKTVNAIRFWSLGEVTRVAVETNAAVEYRYERLSNPERLFFDLFDAVPTVKHRRVWTIPVGDDLIQQIRVAQNQPRVTRIVFDLTGPCDFSASQLANPNRLMIELRRSQPVAAGTGGSAAPQVSASGPPQTSGNSTLAAQAVTVESKPAEPMRALGASPPTSVKDPPEAPAKVPVEPIATTAATKQASGPPPGPVVEPAPLISSAKNQPEAPPPKETAAKPAAATPVQSGAAAKLDSRGQRSLIRALGLKVQRIVLDPGHGGHDMGTIGRGGLAEKDLVLDIAKRLGQLLTERDGTEVIFTRTDDTFVPLEQRTELANQQQADLFISIHANSSRLANTAGIETFYLNFTTSAAALEVAARENASSSRTIHELEALIQKIAKKERTQESREFALAVQKALRAGLRAPGARDRGVKQAPFLVLIGAQMPAVLVETAFLSNPREERLLKRPEYRQTIAEALYKAITQYSATLSHFRIAQSGK